MAAAGGGGERKVRVSKRVRGGQRVRAARLQSSSLAAPKARVEARRCRVTQPLTGYTVPPITRPRGYQVRSSNLQEGASMRAGQLLAGTVPAAATPTRCACEGMRPLPMCACSGAPSARTHGSAGDWRPCSQCCRSPVPHLVEALLGEEDGDAVVEIGVILVDDALILNHREQAAGGSVGGGGEVAHGGGSGGREGCSCWRAQRARRRIFGPRAAGSNRLTGCLAHVRAWDAGLRCRPSGGTGMWVHARQLTGW